MSTAPHLHWGAEALQQTLQPLLPGLSVEVLARVASTNSLLIERARAPGGGFAPCLLVAEEQTQGRGRLGRSWQSHPGTSLTLSLALPLAPQQWGGLSLAVGLALADALDPLPASATAPGPRLGLKWPNDLWLTDAAGKGRKLGGVLIETVSAGQGRLCVVGVGLNVRQQPAVAVSDLSHGYASLDELDPQATPPQVLARLALPLVQALLQFEHLGFAPLVAAYTRRDLLLGRRVQTLAAEPLHGVADGVDEQGALRLRPALPTGRPDADGAVQRIVSGEVSVRLAA
jgi:BirA family biotin operon repressor/biotin-[acetyl-CoA-carboxylase] ligase